MFIYDYNNRKEEIKQFKKLLKLNSPDYKGGEFTGMMRASVQGGNQIICGISANSLGT